MAYGSQGIQGQDIIPRELLDDYAELFSNEYVVILAQKPNVFVLVTAYHVSESWAVKDLKRKRSKGTPF
mgnify:CR=1 FL=1